MRGHFANVFVVVMQIVSEKGCAAERVCFCTPFSSSLSLCLTKANLNMCACGCVRAHAFGILLMFIGTGACGSSDHHFDGARSGSWAKWEGTWWKESGGTRKGECFTCTIWSHWSTHGWVSYLNGKARGVRRVLQMWLPLPSAEH